MKLSKTLPIAEIGINHNGDMALAEEMIRAAARSGADAVKFQNYRTEDFLSDSTLTHRYMSQGGWVIESQFQMFKRCELQPDALQRLKRCCDREGVLFFSTPTNYTGVEELVRLGAAYIKNGSDYLGHLPLIRHMAGSGLPCILSTGMATEEEIAEAVEAFRSAFGRELVLLVCTSSYPTPPESVHLKRITTLAARFGYPVGFSDHTHGWEAAVAAVCLGACMIEKHFTTDKNLPGPDHCFSADPEEFLELSRRVRQVELLLGRAYLSPAEAESGAREQFRLSCVAEADLPVGHVLRIEDVGFRRPGTGMRPALVEYLLGRVLKTAVARGAVFTSDHLL
jgi:N,N'-diacetyllegionaminate synthase